jgi:hypothetical protein
MADDIRKCKVCGKEYRYCPRCKEFAGLPTWMLEFDKEECRMIYYDVVNKYAFKHITKEEALKRLEGIDLSMRDNCPPDVKKVLDDILYVEVKAEEEQSEEKPVEVVKSGFKHKRIKNKA